MANDEVARLVAVMEANLKGFTKGMEQAQRIADQRFGAIEKRMRKTESVFSGGFKNIGNALVGGAAFYAVERFVGKVVDTASKLKDASVQLGVSTDALQEWGTLAARSGVDIDSFNSALGRFSKAIGEAQVKGGDMAKLFAGLGVDITRGPESAFLQFADAIAQTGNQQQKAALTTAVLGREGGKLIPLLQEGSAAIRTQGDELKRTGAIMTAEAINKIDDLGDKWGDLKKIFIATGGNILAGAADEFGKFADELSSPAFQQGLQNFGKILAEVATNVAKIAAYAPDLIAIGAGFRLGGPVGAGIAAGADLAARAAQRQSGNGTDTIESLRAKLAQAQARAASERGLAAEGARQQVAALQAQLAARQLPFLAPESFHPGAIGAPAGTKDRSGLLATAGTPMVNEFQKAMDEADQHAAEALQDIIDKRQELINDADEREAQELQDFLDQRQELIDAANEREAQDLQDFQDKRQQLIDEADQRAAEKIGAAQIDQADKLRDAFDLTGAAGVRAFENIGDAAKQMLQQLAAASFQLYIMKPLLDALLGKRGEPLGGLVGDALSFIGISGRASGGPVSAGTPYMVGEHGKELFVPSVPGNIVSNRGLGGGAIINIDARGAQMGVAEQIDEKLRKFFPVVVGASVTSVRRGLPAMMAETSKRHF